MDYVEARDFIWSLTNYERRTGYDYSAARFDLGRVRDLLHRLGDPHESIPVAHVAGTKGKGSTAAIMASICRSAGWRTGLYTSPHLHTIRERIQVDGANLSREAFAAAVSRVAEAMPGIEGITSFEALTAAAFTAFAAEGVDTAVIEVGLGGRLDATNVIAPYVSVITSISKDHTAILGDSLAAIAGEKAGIIKPGIPVVSAAQDPEAARVIRARAKEVSAPIEWVGEQWRYAVGAFSQGGQEFAVTGPERPRPMADGSYVLPLLGEHQVENAVLALAAMEKMPGTFGLVHRHLVDGVAGVCWPGRFEIVRRSPYLVLDGAHNADSFRRLRDALERHLGYNALHLVFGASRDKDIAGMLSAMRQPGLTVYICRSEHDRSAEADAIAAIAGELGISHRIAGTVEEALWAALSAASRDDCICVAGSLFVVAAAREAVARRFGRIASGDGEIEVVSLGDDWRIPLVRA